LVPQGDEGTREIARTFADEAPLEETMQQPGLDQCHRDKNGEISRKHGNTLIATLRHIYGAQFAPGAKPEEKLSDVLPHMDEPSRGNWSMIMKAATSTGS
jgi:hypothetical protein